MVFTVTVIIIENAFTERDMDGYPSQPFNVSSALPVGKSSVFFSLVRTNGSGQSMLFNRKL
jgi:hypothetical protein